jgi:hypothetical protein
VIDLDAGNSLEAQSPCKEEGILDTPVQEPLREPPGRDHGMSGAAVDLYWLPLGAGGCVVRLNGRVYERLVALAERRPPLDLYHAALEVRLPEGAYAIESTPVPDDEGWRRGVVAGGPVGSRWAGGLRIFRYEVRCWRGGVIPDLAEAVESPVRLSEDEESARRILKAAPRLPTPVWGRDELRAGEMWNSNSIIAWLLASAGFDVPAIRLPAHGRAPGWGAGLVVARRRQAAPEG